VAILDLQAWGAWCAWWLEFAKLPVRKPFRQRERAGPRATRRGERIPTRTRGWGGSRFYCRARTGEWGWGAKPVAQEGRGWCGESLRRDREEAKLTAWHSSALQHKTV
jgi:hypothetical protein